MQTKPPNFEDIKIRQTLQPLCMNCACKIYILRSYKQNKDRKINGGRVRLIRNIFHCCQKILTGSHILLQRINRGIAQYLFPDLLDENGEKEKRQRKRKSNLQGSDIKQQLSLSQLLVVSCIVNHDSRLLSISCIIDTR